mmetsp:Transcript_7103/g.24605  ORF Transcript_7103/g.24605 Transcript_7103/m.24605 type:complete len:297 (-) Transcript_7103:602-1492(-)
MPAPRSYSAGSWSSMNCSSPAAELAIDCASPRRPPGRAGSSTTVRRKSSNPMMPTTGSGAPVTTPVSSISMKRGSLMWTAPIEIVEPRRNWHRTLCPTPLTNSSPNASIPRASAARGVITNPLAPVSRMKSPISSPFTLGFTSTCPLRVRTMGTEPGASWSNVVSDGRALPAGRKKRDGSTAARGTRLASFVSKTWRPPATAECSVLRGKVARGSTSAQSKYVQRSRSPHTGRSMYSGSHVSVLTTTRAVTRPPRMAMFTTTSPAAHGARGSAPSFSPESSSVLTSRRARGPGRSQ